MDETITETGALDYAINIATDGELNQPTTSELFNMLAITLFGYHNKDGLTPEQLLDHKNEKSPLYPQLSVLPDEVKSRWQTLYSSFLSAQAESDKPTEADT